MNLKVAKDVAVRITALFVTSALGIITVSSVLQGVTDVTVPVWFQALQAGASAVATVVYQLAKAMTDGDGLTKAEVDQAFGIDRSKHDHA